MSALQDLLRGLSIHDATAVNEAMTGRSAAASPLEPRVQSLLVVAALIALEGPAESIDRAVTAVRMSGGSAEQTAAVLLVIAPVIGSARIVAMAPLIAAALGWDIETELAQLDPPQR